MWRRARLKCGGEGGVRGGRPDDGERPFVQERASGGGRDAVSRERAARVDREADHGVSLLLSGDGLRRVAPDAVRSSGGSGGDRRRSGSFWPCRATESSRKPSAPTPERAAPPRGGGVPAGPRFPGALSVRRSSPFPARELPSMSMRVVRARTSAWPASDASTKGMRNFFAVMGCRTPSIFPVDHGGIHGKSQRRTRGRVGREEDFFPGAAKQEKWE